MKLICRESVRIQSRGEWLAGELCLPVSEESSPAIVICHGAGEFKENYFELAEYLGQRGIGSLAIDMHGHGASEGERYHVAMPEWVADVQSALTFLSNHTGVDGNRLGGFGLSSGGTAILEAALADYRLKSIVLLDATVRNSVPAALSVFLKALVAIGTIKRWFTKQDLRVNLAKMSGEMHLTSDPEINARLLANTEGMAAFKEYPFPGAAQAFFVDTIKRLPQIQSPTLVIWGEDDKIDPPETGRLLHEVLTCKKALEIIAGNGHLGHLDRNRERVFELTANWLLETLCASSEQSSGSEQQRACQAG